MPIGKLINQLSYQELELYTQYSMQQPLGTDKKLEFLFGRLFLFMHCLFTDDHQGKNFKLEEWIPYLKYSEHTEVNNE